MFSDDLDDTKGEEGDEDLSAQPQVFSELVRAAKEVKSKSRSYTIREMEDLKKMFAGERGKLANKVYYLSRKHAQGVTAQKALLLVTLFTCRVPFRSQRITLEVYIKDFEFHLFL